MTKQSVCEALDWAIERAEENMDIQTKQYCALHQTELPLLRTLKERIERGVVTQDAWGDVESLIIDWSEREGEAG